MAGVKVIRRLSVLGLGILLGSVHLEAQGGPTTIQFSFSNPGARSLGMGGAFAAVADDATAAFANPAGLTQLTRPEISVEGRHWSYSTPFTVSGRVHGEPTGIGLDGLIRTEYSEFDSTSLSLPVRCLPGTQLDTGFEPASVSQIRGPFPDAGPVHR